MILKNKPLSEIEIQSEIIECLNAHRIGFFWRQNNQGVYDPLNNTFRKPSKGSIKGVSDILGIMNGRFIAIEVKTSKAFMWYTSFWSMLRDRGRAETYSPKTKDEQHALNQILFMERVIRNGGVAFMAHSFEQVLKKLKEI